MNNGTLVFRGGLPYRPDLRKLDEAFPLENLTEGRIIEHKMIEEILGYKWQSHRYYAVLKAWMGHQRNDNRIYLVFEPKVGVKVLDPSGLLSHAEKVTRQKLTQTGKALRIFGWVERDRLDDTGKKRFDHQAGVVTTIRSAVESARKQLSVELSPIKSLPKPPLR